MVNRKLIIKFIILVAALFYCIMTLRIDDIENTRISKDFLQEPQIFIPVNIATEEFDQRQVDKGHSPWRLDLVQSTITFVSLKISPEGIKGPFPVKEENIKIIQESNIVSIVEVKGNTPINRVYFQRLIRQNETGIWTVVGYDEVSVLNLRANKNEQICYLDESFTFACNIRQSLIN